MFYRVFQIVLMSVGDIVLITPVIHRTFCEIDGSNWPWGHQNCSLIFGSWTYSDKSINLLVYDEPSMGGAIDFKYFINPRVSFFNKVSLTCCIGSTILGAGFCSYEHFWFSSRKSSPCHLLTQSLTLLKVS